MTGGTMRRRGRWSVVALVLALAACRGGGDDGATAPVPPPTSQSGSEAGPDTGATTESGDATVAPSPTSAPSSAPVTTAEPVEPSPVRCDPAAASTSDGAPTLRVWHGMAGDVEGFLQLLADRFEAEHPQFRVEIEKIEDGYPAAIDALRTRPADQLPDLMMGSNEMVRLQADSGRFIAPAECTGGVEPEQFADLLPVIRRTYTVEGTLWASPFNISAPVMLFDALRWERAGLDPSDPPSDFEELEQVIRQLKDSGAAATGAVLFDRSALWFIDQPAARSGQLLAEPTNGRSGLQVDRITAARPETVETLRALQELKRDGYILWSTPNSNNEDLAQLVHPTEPSGLTFNSSAVIGDVIRLAEVGAIPDVEIGIAPFPGPGVGSTAGGGAWWILDRGDPERAGAAWTLADWLTQPELLAEFAAYTGYVPTTKRAAEHPITEQRWAEWPVLRVAYDQLAAAPDSDAAAGLQVGPLVEVNRNLELAAAFSIDVGNDPQAELRNAEDRSLDVISLYADVVSPEGG